MLAMHFCLVCNMNKTRRVFVVYLLLLVVAATGAAELKSKNQFNSKVERTGKPQSSSKVEQTGNPQSSSKVEQTGKPQSSSKVEQTDKPKESVSATKKPTSRHISAHASINHGMRVASITAVDSRNGRLSSMAGYKFYPQIDSSKVKTDSKGNFIFKSADGKMPMPITITKQGDGVSGTIRIMPGSVSVSSSAKSGSASASVGSKIPDFNPWSSSFMKPMINDLFFPDPFPAFPSISGSAYHTRFSEPTFHRIPEPSFPRMSQSSFSRIQQPSFSPRMPDPWKDMYKHPLPQHDMMTPGWYYPSYNPYFNFW